MLPSAFNALSAYTPVLPLQLSSALSSFLQINGTRNLARLIAQSAVQVGRGAGHGWGLQACGGSSAVEEEHSWESLRKAWWSLQGFLL